MYRKFMEQLKKYQTIIIHRHQKPDGDALGSQIGLKEILVSNFPNKKVYVVGEESDKYSFIGKMDIIKDEEYQEALVFVLDTSEKRMISDDRYQKSKFIIKIDHHVEKEKYANLEIINSNYESCARLVCDICAKSGLKINEKAAQAIFTGIVTDSGRFRYSSSTTDTFKVASKLLKIGVDTNDIYNNLYNEDLKTVRLRAYFCLNFKTTKNNVAYMKTTKEEVKKHNVDLFTISRGMVNTMAGIKGIDIWANFTEDEVNNSIICELRSSKYNVNTIATKYSGGGHILASGMTVKTWEEVDQVINDLDNILEVTSE